MGGFMTLKTRFLKFRYKRLCFLLLIPIATGLYAWSLRDPWNTYRIYTQNFYYPLMRTAGKLVSLVSFSLGEWVVYLTLLTTFIVLTLFIKKLILQKGQWKKLLKQGLATLLAVGSIIYFLFTMFLQLNYQIPSYADFIQMELEPVPLEDLEEVCLSLIGTANKQRQDLHQPGVPFSFSEQSVTEIALDAQSLYQSFANDKEYFNIYTPRPKLVLFSKGMSYLDITGMYFPFTFEANVNVHVPDYTIPATMLHELSHAHGFMQESEANFLAYKVGQESKDPVFAYSGTMLALIYSTNAYYTSASVEDYQQMMGLLSEDVWRDLQQNNAYWKAFRTPVAEISKKVNDSYLKANRQSDGIQSYGRMVDLLIADYKIQKNQG